MSALYGRLTGERSRKTVTRKGFTTVESSLETWSGSVRTILERDGTFRVYAGEKYSPRHLVATGNVNDLALGYVPIEKTPQQVTLPVVDKEKLKQAGKIREVKIPIPRKSE